MISLFALIMALGIIVDDAIVVGEDAQAHFDMGEDPLMASEGGARRMLAPVMASSLTTIAAFLPLMLIGLPNIYGAWLMPIYGYTQHGGQQFAVSRQDARVGFRHVSLHHFMQARQVVVGHEREHVMLDVVVHVPIEVAVDHVHVHRAAVDPVIKYVLG